MMVQQQFLEVLDRGEAQRRFQAALSLAPCGEEFVPVAEALGRVLSRDVIAGVDVPSFDRSNFDGFAIQAADTYRATEESPPAKARRIWQSAAWSVQYRPIARLARRELRSMESPRL